MIDESLETSVFERHPLLIARMDQLSRSEVLSEKLERSDWDLVVVDEAHRMSAHYFGAELKTTKRYELGKRLGGVTRHLLLMTATPHAGKQEDFQLFLALLDGDRFEGKFRDGVPTGVDTPTSAAASSLVTPLATNRQNARSTARDGSGRPGERIGGRNARSAAHCRRPPAARTVVVALFDDLDCDATDHLQIEVLRRPLEFANQQRSSGGNEKSVKGPLVLPELRSPTGPTRRRSSSLSPDRLITPSDLGTPVEAELRAVDVRWVGHVLVRRTLVLPWGVLVMMRSSTSCRAAHRPMGSHASWLWWPDVLGWR